MQARTARGDAFRGARESAQDALRQMECTAARHEDRLRAMLAQAGEVAAAP
jgi:hypothetical protein